MQTTYVVSGMTCAHCVAHVTGEVSALPGVQQVEVSLEGPMVVTSEDPLDFKAIQEAVSEAGDYTVALAD